MKLGKLLRAYAWEVAPRQPEDPGGGKVGQTANLAAGLEAAATRGNLDMGMPVVFKDARTNPMRTDLLAVAYGTAAQAATSSREIAKRLRDVTDQRTKPSLLVLSSHDGPETGERRVLISTFPQDQVLRRSQRGVDLLDDVFSLTSRLRKAALVDGPNGRTGFLKARVVDYETTKADRTVADFWVARFLGAATEINTREGTDMLARALKGTNARLRDNANAVEQLNAAIATLRTGPKRRRSLQSVADDLLDGPAEAAFRAEVGEGPGTLAVFDVDVARLDAQIQYRVFRLDNGVTVSAPFMAVGPSPDAAVQVTEVDGHRHITASGTVESERLRSRG